MTKRFTSLTAESTEKAGEEFVSTVQAGDVICLYGDLGAGKTTFTKGVAKGLGIIDRIVSPTFSLVRQYLCQHHTIKTLYHIDLYRLETLQDVQNIGIEEILLDEHSLILIEWAEKMQDLLPQSRTEVTITHIDNGREIQITTVQ